ncbi:glycosyltransferase involved in cell wall biosynthesis [Oikeobacillus pervagus]|uniref:Glycosyltransferase involved in cell wall biosynthesis n=1 Tax=Oikeobacillus pervagus TaxID=1325931 RepID=A0AAJ1T3M0_9BACI|nr:glycosyltransferase [Oikeobacillus pervagus]MDQ0215304.1 glycosyltransferase involved in cell wall biosynthesis [Oikeobacillus pervagus]
MSKKVLVISNMYPTDEHKSFGIFVENQVKALRAHGLKVDVSAIKDPRNGKVHVLRKYLTWFLQTLAILIFKGRQYDVVHAHYVFPSGVLGLLFKKLWKTKLVVTAHGGDIDKMARKNAKIHRWTKEILKQADEVIAVGHELKATIEEEFYVHRNKITLLNMGVNREIFYPMDRQEAKRKLQLMEDKPHLLFVGNLIEQKGLLELFQAVSSLKKENGAVRLSVIGANKDAHFYGVLTRLQKELQLEEDIHFLGVKNQQEVALWMSASDVFVLPSHIEGFGLVALEAMACGTPVVGTNVGGLKYLLAEGAGCIVEVQNPSKLQDGIEKVLHERTFRSQLIEKGLQNAEENDQEKIIDKLLSLYFPTGG